MPKEELLEYEGTVTDVLPDARFRVKLENDHEDHRLHSRADEKGIVSARLSATGWTVEMTPYDLEKGRIVYRHKDEHAPANRAQARRNFRGR